MKLHQQGVAIASVLLIAATGCGSMDEDTKGTNFIFEVVKLFDVCDASSIIVCAKEKALKYLEQLPSNLDMGGGIKVVPTDGVKRSARYFNSNSLPKDPEQREEILDTILTDRALAYLSSHTFQFKVPENIIGDLRNGFTEEYEEGRKKKKKGIPISLLIQLKIAAIGALILKGIGLLALKALILAKIALTIASMIALKKILGDKQHTSTYEVIAPHTYEEHGHYERSFGRGESTPYRGYFDN